MKKVTVKIVTTGGEEYSASCNVDGSVTIEFLIGGQWIWAGQARWVGAITDCAAVLPEEVYAALDAALDAALAADYFCD